MNDIIIWIYAFLAALFVCSMVLIPLMGFVYHVTKIKMRELKERIDL